MLANALIGEAVPHRAAARRRSAAAGEAGASHGER